MPRQGRGGRPSGKARAGRGCGPRAVRGGSRAVSGLGPGPSCTEGCAGISPGPGASECRGAALRLCPPRCPAPRPAPAPSSAEGAAGPGGEERTGAVGAAPTKGGPSAAPLRSCPPPGQTAAARRGAMAAGLGPWLLALALGPAGERRARRAARPGPGAAPAAAPRARGGPELGFGAGERLLCVAQGGCVGTRMLRERPWLSPAEEGGWGSAPGLGLRQQRGGSQRSVFGLWALGWLGNVLLPDWMCHAWLPMLSFYRSVCTVETGSIWRRCASTWGVRASVLPGIRLQLWRLSRTVVPSGTWWPSRVAVLHQRWLIYC